MLQHGIPVIKIVLLAMYKVQLNASDPNESSNSNSNSIFIAPNLYPKTDCRRTKQKQKTVIINLRHSKGQRHREK